MDVLVFIVMMIAIGLLIVYFVERCELSAYVEVVALFLGLDFVVVLCSVLF